ncbi:hypothetical protein Patl1_23450 [Pistacia atlantica]|uniref:Uncharacterized protein n=1 Tax=Pistacia atlantica TaxID=434234 RepID=A0ACC0ZXZ5_9ROSI|nr:hypothetical protein Patl1_23450 [Pistacia atlantica]
MADQLRLQFNNETEKISKLYERLKKKEEKNDGKILIILDNLWDDNFDLKSIGIPDQSDDRGCKLLVTARYQHVLKNMGDPKPFPIGNLSEEESWRLFKNMAGDGSSTFGRSYIFGDDGRFMRILSLSFDEPWTSSRMLKLKLTSIIWSEELQGFRNVEFLCIDKLEQGIKNVLYELDKEGFSKLKYLHVHNNPNILCLVDSIKCVPHDAFPAFPLLESLILFNLIELRKICYGQPMAGSFCNLRIIEVRSCTKLENIFSFSNSRSLPQLQRINVSDCKNMKAVFIVEREDDVNINEVICQLRFLTLMNLPRIANFYLEVKTPSTSQSSQESTTDLQYNDINLAHELDTPSPLFNEKV